MSTLATTIGRGVTGSRPAASEAGRLYFDTTVSILYRDNGSSWDSISASALTNPMTTAEDIIVGGASGTPARKAIGAAGAALSVINGGLAYNSGTSFPGSKATGDRYWRTDLGIEAYWDGTRWLSTQLFDMPITPADVPTAGVFSASALIGYMTPWHTTYDLWLERLHVSMRVNTTNNGTSNWTVQLRKRDAAGSASNVGSAATSAADTAGTGATHEVSIGAALTPATYPMLDLLLTKVSAPGTIVVAAGLRYRLILT